VAESFPHSIQRTVPRRAGITLIWAFLLFIVGIPLAMFGSPDRFRAEQAAADDLGVDVRNLPGEVYAQIAREHSSLGIELIGTLPVVTAMIVFAVGIWQATVAGIALDRVARGAAVVAAVAFALDMGLYLTLYAEPGRLVWTTDHFAVLNKSLVAISVMAGCTAVAALALVMRRAGVVGPTGLVVVAFAALGVVAAPVPAVGGMPPVYALLLGVVLAVPLLRYSSRAPMPSLVGNLSG
jgi:hypothetical protein